MTLSSLPVGALVSARFPEQNPQGREQEGYRPAIVVGIPKRLGIPRYQLVILVPMTTDRGQEWAKASPELYPRLAAGIAGLPKPSIALLDQIRAVDVRRVYKYRGNLSAEQCEPILKGIQRMISL